MRSPRYGSGLAGRVGPVASARIVASRRFDQTRSKSGTSGGATPKLQAPELIAPRDHLMSQPPRKAESLYSDIFLPEKTKAIRKEVRAFCDEVLAPV